MVIKILSSIPIFPALVLLYLILYINYQPTHHVGSTCHAGQRWYRRRRGRGAKEREDDSTLFQASLGIEGQGRFACLAYLSRVAGAEKFPVSNPDPAE